MLVLFTACQLSGYSSFLHVDFWLCNLCSLLNREKFWKFFVIISAIAFMVFMYVAIFNPNFAF